MFRRTLVVGLLAGLLVGCNSESKDTIKIAVIPKGTTHAFWSSVRYGAEQAAKELSKDGKAIEILWKGPLSEGDQKGQIDVVREFVQSGVDGICLAPLDSKGLAKYVEEAHGSDVPVVIFDSGLAGSKDTYLAYVATNNYYGGQLAARRLAKALKSTVPSGQKGKVFMFRYAAGSESTEQREEGFLAEIKKFDHVEVINSDEYAGVKKKSAIDKSQSVLKKYFDDKPNVDPKTVGVFAVCESNAEGVLETLRNLDVAGKVRFVAFDPSKGLIKAMEKETAEVHGIILQDPVKMGYLSVRVLVNHLRKKDLGDGIKTGEFITIKKEGDWARVTTGEYDANPANMTEARMKELLNPKQSK